jgi:ABC-type antimicrobial peptide transport system permease subunit
VVLIRSSQPAAGLVAQLRKEVAAIDPELSIENARTLKQLVRDSTSGQRAVSGMINTFMAIALGLVAVGLYGTLSYNVLQRTREFGVRLAIGAVRGDITRLVLKQGSWWVLIGLSVGIAGSLGLAKVLRTIVYGVDPLSTVPLLLGAICVTTAALFACWLPAYRAAKTDPMHALRAD